MKKHLPIFLFIVACSIPVHGQQTLGLNWLKRIGGNSDERVTHLSKLAGGDIICSGYTMSTNGNSVGNHGMTDFFIQCISSQGELKWTKIIGGSKEDGGNFTGNGEYTVATPDGGFLFAGSTSSNDGDIPLMRGSWDIYVAKFTANGVLEWSKTYGGNSTEWVSGIALAEDGGYVLSGSSYSSNDGDIPLNNSVFNNADVWIFKIDKSGTIIWSKLFGGSNEEASHGLKKTKDNGFVFASVTTSEDGDLAGSVTPGSLRKADIWVVKIDANGIIQWKKRFGGSLDDDSPRLCIGSNNEIVVTLSSYSNDLDFASNTGISDIWVMKLTSDGNVVWKKHMGGLSWDSNADVSESPDGNFIVTAFSYSSSLSGFAFANKGESDALIFKLDKFDGSVKWFNSFGGNARDFPMTILTMPDNSFCVAGTTSSVNGDFPNSLGSFDGFIMKFAAFNAIKGYVFYDYNGNNIKDAAEPFVNNVFVLSKKQNMYTSATFTTDGYYYNEVDSGSFTTKVQLYNSGYFLSTPDSFNTSFTSYYQADIKNIAIKPLPGKRDIRSSVFTSSAARPGFESNYQVNCYNAGTDTISSGVIKFVKDSRVAFLSAIPSVASIVGDTLYWNYSNLKPLDTISISIKVKIGAPPIINQGDWLRFKSEVNPVTGDLEPGDNFFTLYHLITGSYDPNDIMETHGDSYFKSNYDRGDYLNYVIRFQNTGNDTAFKVVVTDTLNDKIDGSSIQMIAASHKYKLTVENGHFCKWTFENILLPDSNVNEPKSHGYIVYRVKLKNNLNTGDVINNKASIYFDFNLPVLTNEFQTVIRPDIVNALREYSNSDIKLLVAPNPANGYSLIQISGKLTGKFELRVIDNNGRIVSQQTLNRTSITENLQLPLNMQQFPSGVYYIQLQQKEKVWWQKVVVQ